MGAFYSHDAVHLFLCSKPVGYNPFEQILFEHCHTTNERVVQAKCM